MLRCFGGVIGNLKKRRKSLRCRVIQKFRHTERDSPWHCPQCHNSCSLLWDSGEHNGRRGLASEPPSQTPSHYTLPRSSVSFNPLTIALSLNSLPRSPLPSITSCLCFRSRRARSQGCPSREQCCYETKVRERERNWGSVRGRSNKGSSVLLLHGRKQKTEKQKEGGTGG